MPGQKITNTGERKHAKQLRPMPRRRAEAKRLAMKEDGRMAELQEKWFGTTFDMPDYVTDPNI